MDKISNIKRFRQIVNAFAKHGLGQMIELAGLEEYVSFGMRILLKKDKGTCVKYTNPQRIVMVFEELGPTFIKLGQLLSTRKDQFSDEYIEAFSKLQDKLSPLPFSSVDAVFISEFGESTTGVFEYIDKTPIASGSIGQVHQARLVTGEEVVVKIRKPGIEHIINADIKILFFLAQQIKKMLFKDNDMLDPIKIVKGFEVSIKNELDLSIEGRNIERFTQNSVENTNVHFPCVYWEYTSSRVLVMEKIEGISIGNVNALRESGTDLKKIAHELFDIFLTQMLFDAFFHADPHPGNIIIESNEVIGVIDCGMVVILENYFVESFIDCFVGLFLKDYDRVVKGYMDLGTITDDTDIASFKNDIRNFAEHYMSLPVESVGISDILNDSINVAVRNRMELHPAMFFTTKALVIMEGTIRKIDPGFDFVGNCSEFAKVLLLKRKFDPKKVFIKGFDFIYELAEMARVLPQKTFKILNKIENEKIGISFTLSASDDLCKKMDSYATRIALSMISTGICIASSIVLHAKIPPLVFGMSLFACFGYCLALFSGVWVVLIIFRKGR